MDDLRVVVTGWGTANPAGFSVAETWSAVRSGRAVPRSAAAGVSQTLPRVGEISFTGLPVRKKEIKRMNRADALGVVAATSAAIDSGWHAGSLEDSTGLFLGTTKDIGSVDDFLQLFEPVARCGFAEGAAQMVEIATRYLTPFVLLDCMPNLALHYISETLKLRGDNCCFLNTGAAGTSSLITAYRAISSGGSTAALAGGFDSLIDRLAVARLASLGLLSVDPGESACRPFDRRRDGFLPGEGAAVMVLEERESALARGAAIRGEILGAGSACDPTCDLRARNGQAVAAAFLAALASARIDPGDIGFVVASGDGTVEGDRAEAWGIRSVVLDRVPVTAFKGVFGHLMAASGPLESILAFQALADEEVPPICGCDEPDEACGLWLNLDHALSSCGRFAVVLSTGTGGQACAVVLGREI